ncbi:integral membrane protein [Grosmannia clavigera kw1407]|uniref:Integral membrane protein n=1 Tax=Grosmannia clavigera (strain kw1407 / UAMH 11150) TaxID=655863 RepID=F0XUW6_GROCL|nr:uncharacterized protein CMQ_4275 [Grosmannia clavigera kw1407]EFW98423.1 integral membrane protein [Grosmannia clavigera kw1407]
MPMPMLMAMLLLVLLAGTGIQPTAAASVPFQNCLSNNYIDNDLVLLQWVPLLVDASFSTNATHKLVITMYGNVTGSFSGATLPAWNSSAWNTSTDGKILEKPDPTSANPKLTTLHSKVNVLSYEPWEKDTDFCNTSLVNAQCPLGPVFNTTPIAYDTLPAVSISNNFYSTYAFTSFSATFIIRYGDSAVTNIGCVSTTVTPDLGHLAQLVKFLPLMVLLAVGIATIFAAIYSPWGTPNIFHWTSNYGRDPDLLRLVTPGFGDCLQYIQFVVLTGGLTLSYPGFYQPIVSQASWSTLMFNHSFVSKTTLPKVVDGIYYTNGTYGLQDMGQLVGMAQSEDIWPGMMVWLLAIIAAALALFQIAFGLQWAYRFLRRIPEEDLRSKNLPFSVGNVIRIVFNYFLLPLVALSTFQFVVSPGSPAYTVALAAITLCVIIGFAVWLLRLIISTRPRAVLFDDLSTLLLYGPLYNTYSDEAAAYALTPLFLTLIRGIAVGAVQPAGIAQIVLLAICEVIQILTLHAFRPFHTQSSMNAYHTFFALVRFITIMLMIAFIPALGVSEGSKGWIGYVILVIHAGVMIFGFFLNAIQAMLEVIARMAGAGGDDVSGQTRGGLTKIFGMRQLSRRMPRRSVGAISRQSQLSSSAMLYSDEASKGGYAMPGGRLRSESAGSIGMFVAGRPGQRSSSALDNLSLYGGPLVSGGRNIDGGESSFMPPTMGDMGNFSSQPSPTRKPQTHGTGGPDQAGESTGPYYRPPRRAKRTPAADDDTAPSPADRTRGLWASGDWSPRPVPGDDAASDTVSSPVAAAGGAAGEIGEVDVPYMQPSMISPRTDYSTREVDFYYGVRGERLNSDAPGRKLGTGPADPTGTMSSAAGWFRGLLGGKSKDKGKGFEVVRSARMPPAMLARGGDFEDEGPPPGIPVAMDVIRHGPIESDDEEDAKAQAKRRRHSRSRSAVSAAANPGEAELLDEDGNPGDEISETSETDRAERMDDLEDVSIEPIGLVSDVPPMLPNIDTGGSIHIPSRHQSKASRYAGSNGGAPALPGGALLLDLPSMSRRSSRQSGPAPSSRGPLWATRPPSLPGIAGGGESTLGGSISRLPFERSGSNSSGQGRSSPGSSSAVTAEEFSQVDLREGELSARSNTPGEVGYVQQGSINRIDTNDIHPALRDSGHAAEIVGGQHQ